MMIIMIMADRDFGRRDALTVRLATLNIPPFTKEGKVSLSAMTKTRRIARGRTWV